MAGLESLEARDFDIWTKLSSSAYLGCCKRNISNDGKMGIWWGDNHKCQVLASRVCQWFMKWVSTFETTSWINQESENDWTRMNLFPYSHSRRPTGGSDSCCGLDFTPCLLPTPSFLPCSLHAFFLSFSTLLHFALCPRAAIPRKLTNGTVRVLLWSLLEGGHFLGSIMAWIVPCPQICVLKS